MFDSPRRRRGVLGKKNFLRDWLSAKRRTEEDDYEGEEGWAIENKGREVTGRLRGGDSLIDSDVSRSLSVWKRGIVHGGTTAGDDGFFHLLLVASSREFIDFESPTSRRFRIPLYTFSFEYDGFAFRSRRKKKKRSFSRRFRLIYRFWNCVHGSFCLKKEERKTRTGFILKVKKTRWTWKKMYKL